jgi:hypothetical protein
MKPKKFRELLKCFKKQPQLFFSWGFFIIFVKWKEVG